MCKGMATQKKTDVVRMWQNGDVLLIEVDLDSYHYRVSTDNRGCVAYGNVAASHRAVGPNIHAIKMVNLNESRFAMLSVGPADDPTREEHSAFMEFKMVTSAPTCDRFNQFERPPALAQGCFSVYAIPRKNGLGLVIPRHSAGSTDLSKFAIQGRTVKLHLASSDQTMTTQVSSVNETADDIVLGFSDSIAHLYDSHEQIVNIILMFGDNADGPMVCTDTPQWVLDGLGRKCFVGSGPAEWSDVRG